VNNILAKDENVAKWENYFLRTTAALIEENSVGLINSTVRTIDIVGDVINLLPVLWIANEVVS
jgi:hypothetical protein